MVAIRKGSHRNTQCHIVYVCGMTLYFSYETVVAVESDLGRVRRNNDWGPTTGRHMNDMGVRNISTVLDEEGINAFIEKSMNNFIKQRITAVQSALTKNASPA